MSLKKLHGKPEKSKTIHKNQWKLQNSIEFHRIPKKSKEFKKKSMEGIEFHRNQRIQQKSVGTNGNYRIPDSIEIQRIQNKFVEFNGNYTTPMNFGEFNRNSQKSVEGIKFRRNPVDSIEIRRNQWKLQNFIQTERIQKKFVEINGNCRVPAKSR